jgi:hypothetical protein
MLQTAANNTPARRYERAVEVSKRIRWDIDRDVIRGREFDFSKHFLPDGLSRVNELAFLDARERRLLSQVQGRTYANMFALVERFIAAKVLEVSRDHWLGDQKALEALVRLTDEELKHQELFRRIDAMMAAHMPAGYTVVPAANDVAQVVLSKSTWAVMGLTLDIELFSQVHYRESIEGADGLCPLWKDVFLFHWKEESQHAILDELEWVREDGKITSQARDAAVDDLIVLVGAVDGIVQAQSAADAEYFIATAGRAFSTEEQVAIRNGLLRAYRYQYITSGAQNPRFTDVLGGMITEAQGQRIGAALQPIVSYVSAQ